MRRQKIRPLVNNIILPVIVALVSVALVFVALGSWHVTPYMVENEVNENGTAISGLYNPATNEYEGPTQVVYENETIYNGGLTGHRFNGYGVIKGQEITEEGEIQLWRFEGTFEDGRLEGHGNYSDHLGTYVGFFEGSKPSGQGAYTSYSGWRYEGEFQAGMMTGTGTVYLSDGSTFSGTFEDGMQLSVE